LDVGCATGGFLNTTSAYFKCEGLELSSWARKECRKKGLKVHPKLLEEIIHHKKIVTTLLPCRDFRAPARSNKRTK
jgi:hypothetical protein